VCVRAGVRWLPTTKNAVVRTLIECGATHAFTLPGLGITWMLDEFHEARDRLRVVLTRSEQAASVMAQVVGKLTGKPGVFMGQGPSPAPRGPSASWKRVSPARRWWC
jgi:acetolactate synthase I/II/III large subunit